MWFFVLFNIKKNIASLGYACPSLYNPAEFYVKLISDKSFETIPKDVQSIKFSEPNGSLAAVYSKNDV